MSGENSTSDNVGPSVLANLQSGLTSVTDVGDQAIIFPLAAGAVERLLGRPQLVVPSPSFYF